MEQMYMCIQLVALPHIETLLQMALKHNNLTTY